MKLTRRDLLATSVALGVCPGMHAQVRRGVPAEPFVPSDGANNPMGEGKGIFPGRVVWVHNPEVAKWDGITEPNSVKSATGEWWDDANCDPKIADAMVSRSLQGLTGHKSDKDAWKQLFHHFNKTRNFGDNGYKPGEKISIKINMNNDRSNTAPWQSGRGMPSPQVAHALLRQLVQQAGVPGEDITLYDATGDRYIGDPIYNRIMADKDTRLHKIVFQVNPNRAANGRVMVIPDTTDPIKFSDKGVGTAFVPRCVVEAKYRINLALLRAHGICGVTLCTKNNNGSIYWPSQDYWGPRVYHSFISRSRPLGSYNAFVDIMGHRQIGGKALLYMLDGLYSAEESETNVVRFQSFNDHWTSSIFMSQDPVAIDSVGLDFLRNEPRAKQVHGGSPDNFLHEAAQVGNPPSGTKYDPEQDGTVLTTSLGVHEHWNNAKDKQYSRNLGKKEGIELVSL
ncbi:MAG TPA: DUF362 domain-containing protein [Candidatus Sulfopaludibacter sp.]|jgi:uncharacterized protein (DUF362 family)|nr:DUF362 domain-containing protein [Candidatus Sulfopaludibacter sp.]